MEPEELPAVLDDAYKFVRAGERLLSVLTATGRLSEDLSSLFDLDPDLGPELAAAIEGLQTTTAAIGRAGEFIDARLATTVGRLMGT